MRPTVRIAPALVKDRAVGVVSRVTRHLSTPSSEVYRQILEVINHAGAAGRIPANLPLPAPAYHGHSEVSGRSTLQDRSHNLGGGEHPQPCVLRIREVAPVLLVALS